MLKIYRFFFCLLTFKSSNEIFWFFFFLQNWSLLEGFVELVKIRLMYVLQFEGIWCWKFVLRTWANYVVPINSRKIKIKKLKTLHYLSLSPYHLIVYKYILFCVFTILFQFDVIEMLIKISSLILFHNNLKIGMKRM